MPNSTRSTNDGERAAEGSHQQFLQSHLLVLSKPGPFGKKYLDLVQDAVESRQPSPNPETMAMRARLLARVAEVRAAQGHRV